MSNYPLADLDRNNGRNLAPDELIVLYRVAAHYMMGLDTEDWIDFFHPILDGRITLKTFGTMYARYLANTFCVNLGPIGRGRPDWMIDFHLVHGSEGRLIRNDLDMRTYKTLPNGDWDYHYLNSIETYVTVEVFNKNIYTTSKWSRR